MKSVRAIWRWFCVVSPPAWAVGLALLFYFAIEGLHQFMLAVDAKEESLKFAQASGAAVVAMSIGYAMFRGVAFHPASPFHAAPQRNYLAWLALTPWRHPKPLPLGPVDVVAQDFVWLALLELLLLDGLFAMRVLIPAVFIVVLAASWAVWVWILDSRTAAYEIGYALGAAIWLASWSWWVAGIVLAATYYLALQRFRQSFAAFPWEAFRTRQQQKRQTRSLMHRAQSGAGRSANWGWTYDVLSPQRAEQLPIRDRLLLSILLGWGCLAVLAHSLNQLAATMFSGYAIFGAGIYTIWQVLRYTRGHAPPISLLGRLATGHWIILSYDMALLPIVYFLSCLAAGVFLASSFLAWPVRFVLPAMLTIYLLLMNLACPDLNRWRLTCKARLSAWSYAADKREFEQL